MIRNIEEKDYDYVIERLDQWWGGRKMSSMLPRLFFKHFNPSCFAFVDSGKIVGFLVGFPSNSVESEAYVHFVGVDPESRKRGIAGQLYNAFFQYCKSRRIKKVRCVTSPKNVTSIRFHHKLGFEASEYDEKGNPVPVQSYDGPGEDRVLFEIRMGN